MMKSRIGYGTSTKESRLAYKREYYRQWRAKFPEKVTKAAVKWRIRNPDKARNISNNWKKNNPAKHSAINARRKAAKLYRTVTWADNTLIKTFYEEANRLTKETGILHTVDHIIPLQGKLVSGLHVHNNLQILTGVENSAKGNSFG